MSSDIPRPEHPRPQRRRDTWQSLNGTWEFAFDFGKSGTERGLPEADGLDQEITVPFPPESELSGIGYTDFIPAVWYRREFEVPPDWLDGRLLCHFGAVDYAAEIWANGEHIGSHQGGYTPFTVDLTDAVGPGRNVLTVSVEDDVRSPHQPSGKQSTEYESAGVMYTRITGIWQSVWLEPVPEPYIGPIHLRPHPDDGSVSVEAEIIGTNTDTEISADVSLDGRSVGNATLPVAGRADGRIQLEEVRQWSPESPALYDIELTLLENGTPIDTLHSYFGLRSVHVENGTLYLNGEPTFQRLVLDQGYYPDGLYTAPSDDALRTDIELAQEMGFDGARLHQKVFEPRYLYWADQLGFLVWGEFPDWGIDYGDLSVLSPLLREWLAVLERDRNHPAVVGWTPFNETPHDQDDNLLLTVARVTKSVDPSRPIIDASGYHHVETDVIDIHDYTQDVAEFRDRYARLAAGKVITFDGDRIQEAYDRDATYVSEYGGIWWNPEAEEGWGYGDRPEDAEDFLSRYRGLTEALLEHPTISALCYTQLYDIEQEVNGLYTYDREPKFDPDSVREITAQPATLPATDSDH